MGGPPGSQVAPLPTNLPFRVVSKTIGCGAYASIRKAIPQHKSGPVIAVKFINKDHAFKAGRLRPKQLQIELSLHKNVSPHHNIIKYIHHGEDERWVWLALELAEGGDLFDKIEADEGVGEDVAHFYFTQLVSAISWCHGKGVAHRDIKPENMLLSAEGDLKLADFGLATQFLEPKTGNRKVCGMVCGSPPYIAPEIIAVGNTNQKRKNGEDKVGYDPEVADVWSCAIVLFVLLVGNTPWDSPVMDESYEYHDYVTSKGRPSDELWQNIPAESLSLVRGMLNIDPKDRFTLDTAKKHPWYTRPNEHINHKGRAANPVALATQMLESLHIDFAAPVQASQRGRPPRQSQGDAMDIDGMQPGNFASTQPEAPIADAPFDWEAPPRLGAGGISASQPQTVDDRTAAAATTSARNAGVDLQDLFSEDPSMSQFSATPSVPLTLTQVARQFNHIVPAHSLARFISLLTFGQLLPMLTSALHRLNIPVAPPSQAALDGREQTVSIRIKTLDARHQLLQGNVLVEKIRLQGNAATGTGGVEVLEVRFIKAKGDPLGWRRLFKQVAVLCKDGIVGAGQQS
ncbi:Serine/threonine-protein kinase chk1 [Pseudocercospora fuligena]|uniref:non-specific serine/threonine protein kinase n=1 Tax=Pseudocercospora fuligena TaxID=685502 RepID=A0A8H6RMK3_9PEZI|nr:Serine/threonine-protein kinase chk1 [Pseudocercospora fuligena]